MQHIWAPWRMTYLQGESKETGCIFCDKFKDADARSSLVLSQTDRSVVMLNKYPYNSGHLLLAPKRHTNQLSVLLKEEYEDICECLRAAVDIVVEVLKPGGVNLGMNLGRSAGAGIEDHLHWHIVPRWDGDTNFMSVVGEARVISQHLLDCYDRLSPFFENLSGQKRD